MRSLLPFLFSVLFACSSSAPADVDADGDGFIPPDDCDDQNIAINPDAEETCDDLDNDCDGEIDDDDFGIADQTLWYLDEDADGFGTEHVWVWACDHPSGYVLDNDDCDDSDATVNPDAEEVCGNDFDDDCRGGDLDCDDADEDDDSYSVNNGDCDDTDATIYPGATEHCDGVDEDCDEEFDEDAVDMFTWYADADTDSFGDVSVFVVACEPPTGYVAYATDCDDTDAAINPDAEEVCDFVDNNCDGNMDEGFDHPTFYRDLDSDGFGTSAASVVSCEVLSGYSPYDTDCDDTNAASYPGATEICDDLDNDCDGTADEDAVDMPTWYADADSDTFGDASTSVAACDQPSGYVEGTTDCDDTNAASYPGATEICDDLDNDCDGTADEDAVDMPTWYADADSDTFGDASVPAAACDQPSGYVEDATDCDDSDANFHPGATETDCSDPSDYNCDGSTGWADADSDGSAACEDCDDNNFAIYPGATEVCDEVDQDCDSVVDEGLATTDQHPDADGDGYGDPLVSVEDCVMLPGYVTDATDCDDSDANFHPGATETDCSDPSDYNCDGSTGWADADSDGSAACEDCDDNDASAYPGNPEVCDFIDNDCNSSIDEGFDVDADGWTTCDGDCDDTDAAVNPDAIEVCDSVDNDCDGTTDTGSLVGDPWYPDADSDGYGEETSTPTYSCSALSGYSLDATDCDDTDALANPGVTEIYAEYGDGIDQDCNGADDIWFVTDGETFCVTANVFDGCYASGNAYLYGDSPFGGWTGRLSSAGYMTLSATAVGFYCFDFYVAYGGTPRIYEFVLVSDKSAADTTCATSVNTTSSSDWVYAGIDAYCASGTDPYGYCDTDRHSSDSTICLYEDGTDGTTPESCH